MIRTDDFIVRAVELSDVDTLFDMSNETERGEFQESTFHPRSAFEQDYQNGYLFNSENQRLIIESHEKVVLGVVYLYFIRQGVAGYGLIISSNARNKGIGKAVTPIITDYLFKNYPLVRIQADTDVSNIAMQKVLEASGFEREGVLRKYRYHRGRWNDSVAYSIVR